MINGQNESTFLDSVDEVSSDVILVDDSPAGLRREARANLWMFSITQRQAAELTAVQVLEFLQEVVAAKESQLTARYGASHQMYFYCWCDEQASQLRFSLVSAGHGQLPFGQRLAIVPELSSVIDHFLKSPYHDGLPLVDTAAVAVDDLEDQLATVLEIWVQLLPMPQSTRHRQ